jgi:hypothetical protein
MDDGILYDWAWDTPPIGNIEGLVKRIEQDIEETRAARRAQETAKVQPTPSPAPPPPQDRP